MYLNQIFSQPKHSSLSGHKSIPSDGKHSSVNIAILEAMINTSTVSKIMMKTRKELWLFTPTQLFIQGQWWSNLSTHLLQMAQCLLLGVLRTSHSGHISQGWTLDKISINSNSGLKNPGSLALAIVNVIANRIENKVIANAKNEVR